VSKSTAGHSPSGKGLTPGGDARRAPAAAVSAPAVFPADLRQVLDDSPLMMWLSDSTNECIYFNRTYLDFTGRPLAEELGHGWLSAVHPAERTLVQETDEAQVAARRRFDLEYRLRRHDGEFRWILDRCAPRFGADGSFLGYVGNCTDVTQLHESAAESRRWKARYEAALLANGWISFEVERAEDRVTWAAAVESLLGFTAGELTDRNSYIERIHPDDRRRVLEELSALTQSATHGTQVYRFRHRAGHYIWLEVRSYFMRDGEGNAATVIGFVSDVSARIRAVEQLRSSEERFRQLNLELEERVAERTSELRAANEELEAFTYSVSHDLRAPLRHLSGFTDLLRGHLAGEEKTGDAQVRRYLDTIAGAALRMGEMIDKLLALSRVGRGEMHRTPVDLGDLARELMEEMELSLKGRSIEWRIGKLPVAQADRALLRGALQNLLDNAVKFTAGRNPAIIEIGSRSNPREHEITVRDNGAGFDMKYAGKLFGVFQRLHAPGEFEGTGIGLASVRRIISRHGGRVWAEGETGKGASFHFTLPARVDA
jgi:PAS domain S-box-containing protein